MKRQRVARVVAGLVIAASVGAAAFGVVAARRRGEPRELAPKLRLSGLLALRPGEDILADVPLDPRGDGIEDFVALVSIESGAVLRSLPLGPGSEPAALAWSHSGERLATVAWEAKANEQRPVLRVFDAATGIASIETTLAISRETHAQDFFYFRLEFDPTDRNIVAAYLHEFVITDVASGATKKVPSPLPWHTRALRLLDDRTVAATTGLSVATLDLVNGKVWSSFEPTPGGGEADTFAFSPREELIAFPIHEAVGLFSVRTGSLVRKLDLGAEREVRELAFSSDGRALAMGIEDDSASARHGSDYDVYFVRVVRVSDGSLLDEWRLSEEARGAPVGLAVSEERGFFLGRTRDAFRVWPIRR